MFDLVQTAEVISRQIHAFTFREYQLPSIYGYEIVDCEITNERSTEKAGTILCKNNCCILLATIDFNIKLYIDRFQELLDSCKDGDINKVKAIIENGSYIFERNENGWTPLIVSTFHNCKQIVYYLISKGEEIHEKNNNGTNLLMYAKEAFVKYGDDELLKAYLSMGLSPFDEDYNGNNLFYYINQEKISEEKNKD